MGFEGCVKSMPSFLEQQKGAGKIESLENIPHINQPQVAELSPNLKIQNQTHRISGFNPFRAQTQEFEQLQKIQFKARPNQLLIERSNKKKFLTTKMDFQNPQKIASLQMIQTVDLSQNDSFVHTPTLNKIIDEDGNEQINQYIVIKKLGRGAFGKVKLVKNKDTEMKFAMKISNKKKLKKKIFGKHGETAFTKLEKEIAIMKSLCHPNIVRLYEVIDDPEQNKLYLIMEYVQKGAIFSKAFNLSLMEKDKDRVLNDKLTEEQAKKYFRELVLGLDYLHDYANVIHRDIKPDNILIDENDNVKIADFGISELLETNNQIKDGSGTKVFLAPEVWQIGKISCEGKPLDVWAAGVTLYYMIFKKYPYFSRDVNELSLKIQQNQIEFPNKISNELMDLLTKSLEKDPKKRITINEILKHDWLTENGEIEIKNQFIGEFEVSSNKIEEALTKKQKNASIDNNSDQNSEFSQKSLHLQN